MPYYIVGSQNTFISIGYNPPSVSIYNANNVGAVINYWFEPFGPSSNGVLKNIVKIQGIVYDTGSLGSKTLYSTTVSDFSGSASKWVSAVSFTEAFQFAQANSPLPNSDCSSVISYGIVTFL